MKKKSDITIFGASARAACWSAVRAGLVPCAFDQFQDLDFPPGCEVRLISKEPEACFSDVVNDQNEVCLPVGGWENNSQMMRRLEENFSLWNTSAAMTQLVRDPFLVQQILQNHHLPSLRIRNTAEELKDSNWIRKPIAGTGGIGIQRILSASTECQPNEYDQQFIEGESYSAIFFASRQREIHLLGITSQLIGCEELPNCPFAYAGSIGPVLWGSDSKETAIRNTLQLMADALNSRIEFYGLFGFDFVLSQGIPYLVEINPRYSASVEVLELALQKSFLSSFLNPEIIGSNLSGKPIQKQTKKIGKSILYAPCNFQLPEDWDWNVFVRQCGEKNWEYGPWTVPTVSDLPGPGTRFSTGDPICTVWSQGDDIQECREELQKRFHLLKKLLPI